MRPPKLGRTYESALADLLAKFDPNAEVKAGTWLQGPDGAREIDVLVDATKNGRRWRIVFECKDYKFSRKIGIQTVDAFESKLRDLSAQIGVICSNAGFSSGAQAKAKRTNIGLIAIIKDDTFAPYEFNEYVECRAIVFGDFDFTFSTAHKIFPEPDREFLNKKIFDGLSLIEIGAGIIYPRFVVENGFVNGKLSIKYNFDPYWAFLHSGESCALASIQVSSSLKGAWVGKTTTIKGGLGTYNWLSRQYHIIDSGSITITDGLFSEPSHWIKSSRLAPANLSDNMDGLAIDAPVILKNLPEAPKDTSKILMRFDLKNIEIVYCSSSISESLPRRHYQRLWEENFR